MFARAIAKRLFSSQTPTQSKFHGTFNAAMILFDSGKAENSKVHYQTDWLLASMFRINASKLNIHLDCYTLNMDLNTLLLDQQEGDIQKEEEETQPAVV